MHIAQEFLYVAVVVLVPDVDEEEKVIYFVTKHRLQLWKEIIYSQSSFQCAPCDTVEKRRAPFNNVVPNNEEHASAQFKLQPKSEFWLLKLIRSPVMQIFGLVVPFLRDTSEFN